LLHKKRSVAIVDDGGRYISSLSCYDFVNILTNNDDEELNFINLLRPLNEVELNSDNNKICHENDTLVSVIDSMIQCKKNRDIILLTDEGIPKSIISPSDIFELLVRVHESNIYTYNDSSIMKEKRDKRNEDSIKTIEKKGSKKK
jgi:hypothetical protein